MYVWSKLHRCVITWLGLYNCVICTQLSIDLPFPRTEALESSRQLKWEAPDHRNIEIVFKRQTLGNV